MNGRAAAVAAVLTLLWPAVPPAQARGNTVPITNIDQLTSARVLNNFRPDDCRFTNVSTLVTRGSNNPVSGTTGNDLVLGGPLADTINAAGGADCVVGGDGIDTINGGAGTDVCIGGAGVDIFTACETAIQ